MSTEYAAFLSSSTTSASFVVEPGLKNWLGMRLSRLTSLPLASLFVLAPFAGGAAAATQPDTSISHGSGAFSSAAGADGSIVQFFVQDGMSKSSAGSPVRTSELSFERYESRCVADEPSGNTCTTHYLRVTAEPLAANAFTLGPATSSATLAPTPARWYAFDCSIVGGNSSCAEKSGTTTASASWTATGPFDPGATRSVYDGPDCRSTTLSNVNGRPSIGKLTVLGQTYTGTGSMGRDVEVLRSC